MIDRPTFRPLIPLRSRRAAAPHDGVCDSCAGTPDDEITFALAARPIMITEPQS